MLRVRREELKIVRMIFRPIIVLVVNNLGWIEVSAECLLHCKAMLSNLAVTVRKRMIRPVQKDVPVIVNRPPSIPEPILRT